MKEIFLEQFKKKAEITEFYLPRDCPAFCTGCCNCIFKGEHTCKDAIYIQKIASIIIGSGFDCNGLARLCDAYNRCNRKPCLTISLIYGYTSSSFLMFAKRAVIITQCLGAGAKSTAKDIKHSLSWWGISKIKSVYRQTDEGYCLE